MGYLYEACDQISDFCHQTEEHAFWLFIAVISIEQGQTLEKKPTYN
jgi:hypothetical protein